MKKSNLITGLVYAVAGIIFLATALLTDSKLDSLLFGFAGAGIIPGLVLICKYLYWNRAENRERYQEKLANDKIEQHDELKEKIRDKSGRYAYLLGLAVVSISIIVFSVLGQLEVINNSRIIVIFLGVYVLFQIIIGVLIFNHLLRKYR